MRILLVDDSAAMRSFVRRVIVLSGVEAETWHEAPDGQAALDVLAEHDVDIVFCDINMPRMNGEDFLKQLSATGRQGTPPVVIVSTDATSRRVQSVLDLGARSYIQKPFSPERMREVVLEVLGEEVLQ